jgi:signal transduction histidine kinase
MGRQSRMVLGVAAAALLALLAIFAVELIDSQSKARRDVQSRFRDRAKVSAALTESLFTSTASESQADNARRYGAAQVSERTLANQQKQGRLLYMMVLDARGRIIASSPKTSAAAKQAVQSKPAYVQQALKGKPFALSNVRGAGTPKATLGFAQPFRSRLGQRILVSGFPTTLLYKFIGGYLSQIPNRRKSGRAYVLDQQGAIVGSPDKGRRPGEIVSESGLLTALSKQTHGSYGSDRYFAASAVKGSPWRVVVTSSKSDLFASETGARKWVPWILFGAFAAAAAFALVLLRRVLRNAAEVAKVNAQLGVANKRLERRARELARSNEELEQFASIASHDLQEPLRKVRTFAEQLIRVDGDGLSERGRHYLEGMDGAADRMQSLIQDLLTFSRIATRERPAEEVQLTQVAHDVVDDLGAVIKDVDANVEIGELPTVFADPFQMRQLLQNLISNGLKFAREGVPPVIEVDGRTRGDIAEITVSDNGIGFDPRYATRIFRVFERLHGRNTYPGTGIGLALCRRVVERHGGDIVASSTPGEGSTFTVTLPLQPLDPLPVFELHRERVEEEEEPLVPA